MSTPYEMAVLVEMTPFEPMRQLGEPTIKRVIRAYESKERAALDLELLGDVDEFKSYAVLTVPHIER